MDGHKRYSCGILAHEKPTPGREDIIRKSGTLSDAGESTACAKWSASAIKTGSNDKITSKAQTSPKSNATQVPNTAVGNTADSMTRPPLDFFIVPVKDSSILSLM